MSSQLSLREFRAAFEGGSASARCAVTRQLRDNIHESVLLGKPASETSVRWLKWVCNLTMEKRMEYFRVQDACKALSGVSASGSEFFQKEYRKMILHDMRLLGSLLFTFMPAHEGSGDAGDAQRAGFSFVQSRWRDDFRWLVQPDGKWQSEEVINYGQLRIKAEKLFGKMLNWVP